MKKIITLLFITFFSINNFSQTTAKRTTEFNLENKVAIQGYNPVAYFTQKRAVKGKSSITSTYEGVVYHFLTQANKDLFLKNQSSYEPQYGGWCAYAMGSSGEKLKLIQKHSKLLMENCFCFTMLISIIP